MENVLCLVLDCFPINLLKKLFLVSRRLNHLISHMFKYFTILDYSSEDLYRSYVPIELFKFTNIKKKILKEIFFNNQDHIQNENYRIDINDIIYLISYFPKYNLYSHKIYSLKISYITKNKLCSFILSKEETNKINIKEISNSNEYGLELMLDSQLLKFIGDVSKDKIDKNEVKIWKKIFDKNKKILNEEIFKIIVEIKNEYYKIMFLNIIDNLKEGENVVGIIYKQDHTNIYLLEIGGTYISFKITISENIYHSFCANCFKYIINEFSPRYVAYLF